MPVDGYIKIRMLKLYEILRQESDEEHPIGTTALITKLQAQGISCERKAIYRCINELNASGFEIICERGQSNRYYVVNRDFDVPELRILIDAVQAASFITECKSKDLVNKVAALGGSHRGQILKRHTYFNTTKSKNESIYYNVAELDDAIVAKKKVTFKYFDYDEKGGRVYRKNGERYEVNPLALVFSNDNYYLVCFSDKYLNLANYRIDRMEDVRMTDTKITNAECATTFNVNEYRKEKFSMYIGKKTKVDMEFDESLIDTIMDKFGAGQISKTPNGRCRVSVTVDVSPMFYGWCSGFADRLKLLYPKSVVEGYKEHMIKAMKQYE